MVIYMVMAINCFFSNAYFWFKTNVEYEFLGLEKLIKNFGYLLYWSIIVNNFDEDGYISIKRAVATTAEPSFTILFHVDKDGNLYMGDPDTNGTVRLTNDSGVFKVYVREAGVYNHKGGFG